MYGNGLGRGLRSQRDLVNSRCYLAGRTFLHSANNSLSGQVNQDVGAVIIQSHVVAIECDNTQVWHHRAATWQRENCINKHATYKDHCNKLWIETTIYGLTQSLEKTGFITNNISYRGTATVDSRGLCWWAGACPPDCTGAGSCWRDSVETSCEAADLRWNRSALHSHRRGTRREAAERDHNVHINNINISQNIVFVIIFTIT